MPAFLGTLLPGWRPYVAVGVLAAVLGAAAYVYALRASNGRLAAEAAAAEAAAAAALKAAEVNARELEAATVRHEADLRRVQARYARRLEAAADAAEREREVLDAPLSDDGRVAPVLRRVLDELRRRAARGRDGNEDHPAGAARPAP